MYVIFCAARHIGGMGVGGVTTQLKLLRECADHLKVHLHYLIPRAINLF